MGVCELTLLMKPTTMFTNKTVKFIANSVWAFDEVLVHLHDCWQQLEHADEQQFEQDSLQA